MDEVAVLSQGATPPETISPSVQCISSALEAIANKRPEELASWLAILPLNKISVEAGDKLLTTLLIQCWEYNSSPCIETIFTAWEHVYPREERIPFYVILFTIQLLPIRLLRYLVVNHFKNITFFSVVTDLINIHQESIALACERAWQTFGAQPLPVLDTLKEISDMERNPVTTNFLNDKISSISEYAPIPPWVKDFRFDPRGAPVTNVENLPTYTETRYIPSEPLVNLPSNQDIVEIILQGMRDNNYDFLDQSEVKGRLSSSLELMSNNQKMALIKPILIERTCSSRELDPYLFRLYGPANPMINPSTEEMVYGGERMFLSIIFEEDDDDAGLVVDWFLGYCQWCFRRIRRRWHSVRMPNEAGGWTGCFCCWDHVRKSLLDPNSYDGSIRINVLVLMLIALFEYEMYLIGIQDRQDDGEIIPLEDDLDWSTNKPQSNLISILDIVGPESIN